jgi:hypothetical protein
MIINRLAIFRTSATKQIIATLNEAIAHAEVFILASQDVYRVVLDVCHLTTALGADALYSLISDIPAGQFAPC